MKKLFNILAFVFALSSIAIFAQGCNGQSSNKETAVQETKTPSNQATEVKAYYFHLTHRCATCQAVESVTSEALKEYYGAKVPFQSINIEESTDKTLIDKYKISGQTLIIISGDKVVDITNDAFMNARTSPDKLKAKIKATVDSMM